MTDDIAAALRMELRLARDAGQLAEVGDDVATRYTQAAHLVDTLQSGMQAARDSQKYTTAGLADRSQTLGAPLMAMAESLEREAAQITDGLTAQGDQAWNALLRPPATAEERDIFRELRALIAAEDRMFAEQFLLQAARVGDDTLLRAVLTAPRPPLVLDGARWQPLISDRARDEMRLAVDERVSPQGPQAWRAQYLRTIASHLRRAVING